MMHPKTIIPIKTPWCILKLSFLQSSYQDSNYIYLDMSRTISRVMSWMIIYLDLMLPTGSSDLPQGTTGSRIAFYSVLLRVGFTEPALLPRQRWALTSPFHPYQLKSLAVYFCCTSLGVASTGRYPAPCPMKPGLSSPATFRFRSRDHLSNSISTCLSILYFFSFVKLFLTYFFDIPKVFIISPDIFYVLNSEATATNKFS